MREIKFRVYDKHNKIWKYFRVGECIFDGIIDMESLGEFTGLKDKNGKEIYEGDIVQWLRYKKPVIGKIGWGHAGFWVIGNFGQLYQNGSLEVIGNIYENPDLMETNP